MTLRQYSYSLCTLPNERPSGRKCRHERREPIPALTKSIVRTFQITVPEAFTKTLFRLRTAHGIHAEEDVPQILHDTSRHRRRKRRLPQPLPYPLKLHNRALPYLSSRDSELCTARCSHNFRQFDVRKELAKRFGVGMADSERVRTLVVDALSREDLVGTAGRPGAAEGGIADFFDVRELEVLDGGDAVVHGVVVVPLVALGVEEDHVVGEVVVVVDDVGEEDGGFVASLAGDGEFGVVVVYDLRWQLVRACHP